MIDFTGRTLEGRYRVLEQLGKGGIGTVYLGRHAVIGRKLAIKVLHEKFLGSKEMIGRFYREAQAAAAIGHKNIIEVMDVGATEEGNPFLVMEYLEGESLGHMLKRTGRIDLSAALGIIEQVLLGLGAAHKAGIVHRDLKPDNIFLVNREDEETTVKLIDFGISKIALDDQQTRLTQSGSLLGTPAYMSPEQAMGETTIDHRADLYAVGVLMYEMLTGLRPFEGSNYNALLANILTREPIPPSRAFEDFPQEAEPVLMKAMSRSPSDRFESAAEMLEAIRCLKGFEERKEKLDILASTVVEKKFALGDLGEELSDSAEQNMAAGVIAKMAEESTPSEWASAALRRRARKKRLFLIAAGAALVVLAAGIGVVLSIRGENGTAEQGGIEAAAQAPTANPKAVRITVDGVPEGAAMFYDNAEVPMNPFPARRGDALVPLRVEASGYKAFSTSIVPNEDQIIKVELVPVQGQADIEDEAADEKPIETADDQPKKPRASTRPGVKETKSKDNSLKKSGRGAEYVDSFE